MHLISFPDHDRRHFQLPLHAVNEDGAFRGHPVGSDAGIDLAVFADGAFEGGDRPFVGCQHIPHVAVTFADAGLYGVEINIEL